jgi:hypothetical protein
MHPRGKMQPEMLRQACSCNSSLSYISLLNQIRRFCQCFSSTEVRIRGCHRKHGIFTNCELVKILENRAHEGTFLLGLLPVGDMNRIHFHVPYSLPEQTALLPSLGIVSQDKMDDGFKAGHEFETYRCIAQNSGESGDLYFTDGNEDRLGLILSVRPENKVGNET